MLNIGVIGCGIVSGYGHLPSIERLDAWHLTAVADISEDALDRVQEKYTPDHAMTDYQELLAVPGMDAVAVATHVDTHREIVEAALSRGLHVLCEKPMAKGLEECRAMVAAAEAAERLVIVNFNTRSGGVYRLIKERIDAGAVGTVRVVRFVYDWSCHQWQPPERLEHFMREGGPIIDSGVHFFDGVRWYTGQEYERIDANGVVLPPYEYPQHVIASCRMSGGAIGLVEAGWLYCKHSKDQGALFQIDVVGDEGAISFHSPSMMLRVYTKDTTEEKRFEDVGKDFDHTYRLFAESIERGSLTGLADARDGLRATEAAFQALASTKRGPSS